MSSATWWRHNNCTKTFSCFSVFNLKECQITSDIWVGGVTQYLTKVSPKPRLGSPALHKATVTADFCNPGTQKLEQGGTVGRSQTWLYGELEASRGYTKPYISMQTKRCQTYGNFYPSDYRNKNVRGINTHINALIGRKNPGKEDGADGKRFRPQTEVNSVL